MFDFGTAIDLPLIWALLIGFAIFVYVILDGFDLGVGILFPFAPTDNCRNRMIMSIAPFWDGNETWLILGGGGLFAAFPLVYSIVMPAFYTPIIIMLLALIFRGVSFEFRFKATGKMKKFWDYSFHFGSLIAGFAQGLILGGFLEGVSIVNNKFAGLPYGWLTPFSIFCGFALVFSYALLGATWLIYKTCSETHDWARKVAVYVCIYVFFFSGIISLFAPLLNDYIFNRWFDKINLLFIGWLPILVISGFAYLYRVLHRDITPDNDYKPFLISISLFSLLSIGLAYSIWPYIIPYQMTIWQGAAVSRSQSLLLVGALLVVPVILAYTAYSYYVFRGKTDMYEY